MNFGSQYIGPTNQKQYTCESCNRSYTWRRGLWQHMTYECGKDPQFMCSYPGCNYKCKRRGSLKQHLVKHM